MMGVPHYRNWMRCHARAIERRERRRRLLGGAVVLAAFLALGVVL